MLALAARTGCAALALVACAQVHDGPRPCQLETESVDCEAGERCVEVPHLEQSFCMPVCDVPPSIPAACDNGAACAYAGGDTRVCWVGGPVGRGEPCRHGSECAFAMYCNRDLVCEQACGNTADCPTPGDLCEFGVCAPPVPVGAPCYSNWNCSQPFDACLPEDLFTCQARCQGSTCPDGSPCDPVTFACPSVDVEAVDQCSRGPEGPIGCRRNWDQDWACVMTSVGVRRCMRPCDPAGPRCPGPLCLRDPEDADTYVCYNGGSGGYRDACETHYDCRFGACNAAGFCAPKCGEEGLRTCADSTQLWEMGTFVCQDGVCTPEGT